MISDSKQPSMMTRLLGTLFCACYFTFAGTHCAAAGDGKLLGTAGLLSVSGAAGGGISPWAVIAGYGEDTQNGYSASFSGLSTDDFQLRSTSIAAGFRNRLELSLADNRFRADTAPIELQTRTYGAKLRLGGDLIYGKGPQFSLGAQHTRNQSGALLSALNVRNRSGTDLYLSAAKLFLDGPFHRNWLVNANLRSSRAAQAGLLGFDRRRELQFEASTALLLNRHWAIGAEWRDKSISQSSGFSEDNWRDLFVAWFPTKNFSAAIAWVDLGRINSDRQQQGAYFTLQAQF